MRSRLILRLLSVLGPVFFLVLSGCTSFGIPGQRSYSYAPERIYLGSHEVVNVGRFDDRSRYACYNGPLLCESFGMTFDCRCP